MWLVLVIVLGILITSFLLAALATTARAEEESKQLDCISCHQETLEFHDKLGSGNKACWACHDSADMISLRFADGTRLPISDSSQLCGQCHQKRYNAWKEGTHGVPGTVATVKCTDCHDPHQPQMAFLGITKPHPASVPSAPPPPFDLLMIVGISLVFMIGLGIIWARQGERP